VSCWGVVVCAQAAGANVMIGSLTLPYKIGLVALVLAGVFMGGYMTGRNLAREALLKAAMQAYQLREKINAEVYNMDGVGLCLALGGVREECAALMRGMDKTTQGE